MTIKSSTNPTTGKPVSRATKIMSQFDVTPELACEVYDAVLTAKADGTSQAEVFEQFAKKYNIDSALKADIEKTMTAIA